MEYKDECCATGSGVLGSVSKALHSECLLRWHSHCVTFLRYAAKYTADLKDRRHQDRLTVYFCLLTWHFVPRPESFAFRRCSGNSFGDREEIASSVFIFKMAVCMVLRITCRSGDILFEMVP